MKAKGSVSSFETKALVSKIWMRDQRWVNTHHLCISLSVEQARKAIEGVGAKIGTGGQRLAVSLVEQNAHG